MLILGILSENQNYYLLVIELQGKFVYHYNRSKSHRFKFGAGRKKDGALSANRTYYTNGKPDKFLTYQTKMRRRKLTFCSSIIFGYFVKFWPEQIVWSKGTENSQTSKITFE